MSQRVELTAYDGTVLRGTLTECKHGYVVYSSNYPWLFAQADTRFAALKAFIDVLRPTYCVPRGSLN